MSVARLGPGSLAFWPNSRLAAVAGLRPGIMTRGPDRFVRAAAGRRLTGILARSPLARGKVLLHASRSEILEELKERAGNRSQMGVLRALDELYAGRSTEKLQRVLTAVALDPSFTQAIRIKALEMLKERRVFLSHHFPPDLALTLRDRGSVREIERSHLLLRDAPGEDATVVLRSLLDAVMERRRALERYRPPPSEGRESVLVELREAVAKMRLDCNLRRLTAEDVEDLINQESLSLEGRVRLNTWMNRETGLIVRVGNWRIHRSPESGRTVKPDNLEMVGFDVSVPTGRITGVHPTPSLAEAVRPLPATWFLGYVGRQIRHPVNLKNLHKPKTPREVLPFAERPKDSSQRPPSKPL